MSTPFQIIFASLISGLLLGSQVTVATAQTSDSAYIEALKSQYRRPPAITITNQRLVELGRDLFFDPALSASGKTACVSCHLPELGWAVKEAKSRNDSGKLTARRSQTLIGIGHAGAAPIGWDGRNPTLEAQAKSSIATGSMSMRDAPTPVKIEVIEERIRSNSTYVLKFKAALPDAIVAGGSLTTCSTTSAQRRPIEAAAPWSRMIR